MATQAHTFAYSIGQVLELTGLGISNLQVIYSMWSGVTGSDMYFCRWVDADGQVHNKWFKESELND